MRASPPTESKAAPALVEAVREALGALHKAIRFRRMYPVTHEFYRKVLAELHERLLAALAIQEEFTLDVGPQSFSLGGATVYTDERGQQNVPFRFYKDGIQTITFRAGVTQDEVSRFLDALQLDLESKGVSLDDLAINLWNANLVGISFYAVDELDPDAAREQRDPEESPNSPGVRELGARVEELVVRLGTGVLPASAAEVARAPGFVRQLSVGEREVFEIERGEGFSAIEEHERDGADELDEWAKQSPLELAQLRDESDLPLRAIAIIRWITEQGEIGESAAAVEKLLWELLGRYIEEGRLDILNRALAELRIGVLRAEGAARELCQSLVLGIGAPERIDAIVRLVNARKADEKDLGELLSVLPEEALEELSRRFSKVRGDVGRRAILDALVARASASPELLAPIVSGDDPDAAGHAIQALKAQESPWALAIIAHGLESKHADIRTECLRSIPDSELARWDEKIAERLHDPSPGVRGLAARRLATAATQVAATALRERLQVAGLSVEERVGLLRALAIADPMAADVLLAEAGPRPRRLGLLSPGELDPLRHDLVVALRKVTTHAARKYLETCAKSEDKQLRRFCEEALVMTERLRIVPEDMNL